MSTPGWREEWKKELEQRALGDQRGDHLEGYGAPGVCQDDKVQGGDRASACAGAHQVQGGDRASALAGAYQVPCGDRAFASASAYQVPCGDRAFASASLSAYQVPGGDRAPAWAGVHQGPHGDRAVAAEWGMKRAGEEDHFEDQLRSFPIKLPGLPDPATKMASLEAGDWLTQIKPLVGDVSAKANVWWEKVIRRVTEVYNKWLEASPLERLHIVAPKEEDDRKSDRLSQRVTTMLLDAVPHAIRGELIATRKLEVNEILFHIHKVYQPGGIAERQQMLASITGTKEASDPRKAVEDLRLWKRQVLRCQELKLSLPDGLLRLQALDRVMGGLLKKVVQASFRISTFRLQHRLDVKPEEQALNSFFDLLLAEAEYMMMASSEQEAVDGSQGGGKASVKMMNAQGSGAPEANDKTYTGSCRWWGSDKDCRHGKLCKFSHEAPLQDRASRCWNCSSKEHRRSECTARGVEMKDYQKQGGSPGEDNQSKGGGKGDKNQHGKGYGKSKAAGQGKAAGKGKSEEMANQSSSSVSTTSVKTMEGPAPAKEETGQSEVAQGSSAGENLMKEVTSLLKSLKYQSSPQVCAYRLCSMESGERGYTLLDGGATHCLRQAKKGEWEASTPVKVQLASQEVEMRIHPERNTLLVQHQVQPIVPLGKLTKVGYSIRWEEGECSIVSGTGGRL